MPSACASRAIGPVAPVNESTRAGRPVCRTCAAMLSPSRARRAADSKPHAVVPGPGRDRRHGVVGLEALHPREVGVAQQPHLARDGLEDLAGGQPLRDQRRHPPQRCLLVGEPPLRGLGLLGLACPCPRLLGALRAPAVRVR